MAALIDTGLPDLIRSIGTELDDLSIDESTRGRLNNNRVQRLMKSAISDIFRKMRRDKINISSQDPYTFTLSLQPSDTDRYLLPRRERQVFWLKDGDRYLYPLDPREVGRSGFIYRRMGSVGYRLR